MLAVLVPILTFTGRPLRVYTLPVLRNNLRRKTLVIGSPGVSTGETGQHDAIGCQVRTLANCQVHSVSPCLLLHFHLSRDMSRSAPSQRPSPPRPPLFIQNTQTSAYIRKYQPALFLSL